MVHHSPTQPRRCERTQPQECERSQSSGNAEARPGSAHARDERLPAGALPKRRRAAATCASTLHVCRKPYESAGRTYRFWALTCPTCLTCVAPDDLPPETQKLLRTLG
jgi:hypothetical protein